MFNPESGLLRIELKDFNICPPFKQGVLSPVPELRDSSKLQNSSYIDDCTFQQLSTFIHSVRDPVQNRVTLVSGVLWIES